jgi:chemotaxis protein CheX
MESGAVAECVQNIFKDACISLLESLNCAVNIVDNARGDLMDAPIACIDAGSNDIEMIICLQFPVSVLALTYPVQSGIIAVDEERLEDWVSELSNQLIGKVKAKLLLHNCQVDIGLPTTYFGADINSLLSSNSEKNCIYFDVDGETCAFHSSIEVFEDNMVFTIEESDDADGVDEGELELF